ncbi:MAG: ABC transporter ATP-binding protein [Deltaproteobacteria bacterium]|nr:ABC transporter ATP-binding protein [Deltaproteobacteria bacterium]
MIAAGPSLPIVRVQDLRKTFVLRGPWPWSPTREVEALKGVDLELSVGQVLAVVGQSGSGKTTLSRIVLGLEEPSSGEVWLEGRRWDGLSEAERQPRRVHFQYVPQDAMSALDPQQTAAEHVAETLRVLRGRSRAQAREEADALLERLGLATRRDALPRQMSGGEQRRVTLARVLALDPHLVVADEPTSGLDPKRREEVLEDLVGNLPRDAACILVTHDMATARAWCTHAMVMLDGWVIESFDPRTAEPRHPYSRLLFDPWSAPLPSGSLATVGCPFHPDCPFAVDACQTVMPALEPRSGHRVACHAIHALPEPRTATL